MDEEKRFKIKELCINGIENDSSHHMRWYFEQILVALGYDLDTLRKEEENNDYYMEKGIPP